MELWKVNFLFWVMIFGALYGCQTLPSHDPVRNYVSIEKSLLSKMLLAKDSTVIQLEEGHFIFKSSLILDNKKHITLRGRGMDKTILSFKIQENGAEGLKITNSENIILEDFTIEDAAGDNIKITDTKGITIRRIKSAWTGTISEKNGAYALYPVICENVLIEACEVLGASDAGIYVGQSKDVIIRNNRVYWNVAGIESENSENVAIYNNQAYNNTGGILVFDLPGLTRYGRKIKVYDNDVHDNNLMNFAPPGNIVGTVPPGTGIMVLATREVEIFNNTLVNNNTIEVAAVSYALIEAMNGLKSQEDEGAASSAQRFKEEVNLEPEYDPYPGAIYIHDNTYGEVSWLPNLSNDFGKLFLWKFGFDRPQIIWDGMESAQHLLSNGTLNPDYKICIQEVGVKTAILDAANDFEGLVTDPESFNCEI
tara:strand:- start:93 stop:1364 length:1272 start_codon:yes stop_codon:yes gene_type:complete